MSSKIKIHIPINTPEQIIVRDTIAKLLAKESQPVIIKFEELISKVNDESKRFSFSILEIRMEEFDDRDLNDLKELVQIIADKVGDSVVLEVVNESVYLGTASP